jgi:hypothetical protein
VARISESDSFRCLSVEAVEVRHGERLIGTDLAGDLIAARALESAVLKGQLTLIDWQRDGKTIPDRIIILTNNAGSIGRLSNLGPHPTQSVSISFRSIADRLLGIFPRIKISVRWAPAKSFAAAPPPPNLVDTASIDAVRAISRQAAISDWSEKWHASTRSSHSYNEVLRGPPDGKPSQGLRAIAKAKQDKKPTREAESTLFRFLTGHAFTGKFAQRFHAERGIPTAYKCGVDPQTANHVVFDCPRYNAARAVTPHFDFDDQTGRPIKRLAGILRNAGHTEALLRFLESTTGTSAQHGCDRSGLRGHHTVCPIIACSNFGVLTALFCLQPFSVVKFRALTTLVPGTEVRLGVCSFNFFVFSSPCNPCSITYSLRVTQAQGRRLLTVTRVHTL